MYSQSQILPIAQTSSLLYRLKKVVHLNYVLILILSSDKLFCAWKTRPQWVFVTYNLETNHTIFETQVINI